MWICDQVSTSSYQLTENIGKRGTCETLPKGHNQPNPKCIKCYKIHDPIFSMNKRKKERRGNYCRSKES